MNQFVSTVDMAAAVMLEVSVAVLANAYSTKSFIDGTSVNGTDHVLETFIHKLNIIWCY